MFIVGHTTGVKSRCLLWDTQQATSSRCLLWDTQQTQKGLDVVQMVDHIVVASSIDLPTQECVDIVPTVGHVVVVILKTYLDPESCRCCSDGRSCCHGSPIDLPRPRKL